MGGLPVGTKSQLLPTKQEFGGSPNDDDEWWGCERWGGVGDDNDDNDDYEDENDDDDDDDDDEWWWMMGLWEVRWGGADRCRCTAIPLPPFLYILIHFRIWLYIFIFDHTF